MDNRDSYAGGDMTEERSRLSSRKRGVAGVKDGPYVKKKS